jgi:hypothetical protein
MADNNESKKEEAIEHGYSVRCKGCCGFCAFVDRHRVFTILAFAAIGVGIGVGLSFWEPADAGAKQVAIQWVGLIGDLSFCLP